LKETFPEKGTIGYLTPLVVEVTHGRGETVQSDRLIASGDAGKVIHDSGFTLPEPPPASIDAPPSPSAVPSASAAAGDTGEVTTTVSIPILPTPLDKGPIRLRLPPLPVTVARANNDAIVVCTSAHIIEVVEPIAGDVNAKVRGNPSPRAQREEWKSLETVLVGVGVGLVIAILVYVLSRFIRRGAKVEAKKRERPIPWVVAFAELEEIKRSGLLGQGKADVYFDRVSDCVRKYLGARYGLDLLDPEWSGLETTTDEMKALLRRVRPQIGEVARISAFLEESDLVKFARVTPDEAACEDLMRKAEEIIRRTMPVADGRPPVQPSTSPLAPPNDGAPR
jgi:hypothetical protein